MPIDQLHTIGIDYTSAENPEMARSLQIIAVKDFVDYEPIDFRELYPADEAEAKLEKVAFKAAQILLRQRDVVLAEAETFESIGEVAAFVGKIGVQPFGRFAYVKHLELPDGPDMQLVPYGRPGVTVNMLRQSFVIDENIDTSSCASWAKGRLPHAMTRELLVEAEAVHELVHLAGVSDIAYLQHTPAAEGRTDSTRIDAAPSTLQTVEDGKTGGGYLEEGFATLCGHTYIWDKYPEIIVDRRTEVMRSPDGVEVHLPLRHIYSADAHMYAAYAVERLIGCESKLWDVLIDSRAYGAEPSGIQAMVRSEIDRIDSRLFDVLDIADPHDLNSSMAAAALTDMIVGNVSGR